MAEPTNAAEIRTATLLSLASFPGVLGTRLWYHKNEVPDNVVLIIITYCALCLPSGKWGIYNLLCQMTPCTLYVCMYVCISVRPPC